MVKSNLNVTVLTSLRLYILLTTQIKLQIKVFQPNFSEKGLCILAPANG